MWVVVYKWYIWPKHNNALVTNSSVKSRRGTIGIQLSTLEICSASFLFLPALYYGCFYSMLAVNSFNPELSSFNNSTLSWRIHPGQVWMAIFSSMMRFRTYKSCWYFAMLCRWVKWIHVYLRNQMFYFNFHLFELLPSPHDAVGDISALQLVAYTANARIFFEGVVLLAGRFETQFTQYLKLSMKAWIFPPIVSTISLVETIINRYQYVHFGKNRYIPLRQLKPLDGATQVYIIQVICKINSTSRVLLF